MTTIFFRSARSQGLEQLDTARAGSWLHIISPTPEQLEDLSKKYKLDIDLLKDAIDPYESPRIEREGEAVYVFTRYCQPDTAGNATEPLLIVYTPDILLTIMLYEAPVLNRLTSGVEHVLTTQKTKLLLQILAAVNRSYRTYINRVSKQIFSLRSQLKQSDILSNEVLIGFVETGDDLNECLSALQPYQSLLRNLLNGKFMRLYEDDKDLIEDLQLGSSELIELFSSRLKSIMNLRAAYDAIATTELNKIFRRLTSITIFLMIPTIIAGLYGMNVALPGGSHSAAFWEVILLMILVTGSAVAFFRYKRWL